MFSEEIAKSGLTPYIDFFIKDHETRNMVWLLVAEKNASDILKVKTEKVSVKKTPPRKSEVIMLV